jgi:poly(beta-D-mannuronate) C5 epimerase
MEIRNPPTNQLSLKIFLISLSLLPLLLMSSEFDDIDGLISAVTAASTDKSNTEDRCISYNSVEKTITMRCGTNNRLTDIHDTIQDRNVIDRLSGGIWLLNAGIIIQRGATLVIDPQDTKWLKIIADGTNAYPITVLGNLKIDSVKVTSWNPLTNGYAISKGNRELNDALGKYDVTEGFPRPYIRIEEDASGNANITNSEIAYLGYEAGLGEGSTGLTYLGGDNSIIRNNDIHDLYFAFYSKEVGGMIIENNHIHNNGHYGLDPHTRTHDMLIRNNTVHDNGSIGIVCSLDCSHITIENNKAYNNARIGIMLSRNMHDSIVRNNIVYNETQGIFVSKSHGNQIYNNTVSAVRNGIYLKNMSSGNIVHDNIIKSPTNSGIQVNTGATGNTFFRNTILDAPTNKAIVTDKEYAKETNDMEPTRKAIDNSVQTRNTFHDNIVTAAH